MAVAFEAICGECGRRHTFYCPETDTIDAAFIYQSTCPGTGRAIYATDAVDVKVVYARPHGTIVVTKFDP